MSFDNTKSAAECPFSISPEAMLQFKTAYSGESDPDIFGIRIGVKGGGCSGFMHNMEFIKRADVDPEEDLVYLHEGIYFVTDCFSEPYLKGTRVDYIHSLRESGFKFISSEVRKTCGCGSSFS